MQFFGLFGLAGIGVGSLVGAYLVVRKVITGLVGGRDAFRAFQIGTSPWLLLGVLLIVVGVTLDTLQQIESHLLMRHYDGFMKKGKLKARGAAR